MKMITLQKEDVDTTYGSNARDNEYYIELRDSASNPYSFLAMWTTEDNRILVGIGEGRNSPTMDLDEFEELIRSSKTRIQEGKAAYLDYLDKYPEHQ